MPTQIWRDANADKMRAYRRKHYNANKQPYIDRAIAQRKRRRVWGKTLKAGRHCMYCEESFWACLEFHHRDAENKLFTISTAINQNRVTQKSILIEIEKCNVVCSNCHRKIHHGGLSLIGKLSDSNPELVGSNPTSPAIY